MASNDWFETTTAATIYSTDDSVTNPVTGLSMVGGCCGLDLCGNLYGCDFTNDGFDLIAPMVTDSYWD